MYKSDNNHQVAEPPRSLPHEARRKYVALKRELQQAAAAAEVEQDRVRPRRSPRASKMGGIDHGYREHCGSQVLWKMRRCTLECRSTNENKEYIKQLYVNWSGVYKPKGKSSRQLLDCSGPDQGVPLERFVSSAWWSFNFVPYIFAWLRTS